MGNKNLFVPTYRIEECLAQIRECLEVGWTGLGFKTVAFEEEWKKYTGLPHAHFLNSATAGLHLAVRLLKENYKWNEGDEIITTPMTFVSTNNVILQEGLTPVFADVDEYLCLDPKDIAGKITKATKAIIFVGYGGSTGRWLEVASLAKKHKLKLILDAAHMSGTRLNGAIPGKEADIVVYSFQAVKNLPTADAGMICCSDTGMDAMARKLSWLGIDKDTYSRTHSPGSYKWLYEVEAAGFKYHGNSVMAAIGLAQLPYLDQDNAYRRQIAAWYTAFLSGHEEKIRPTPIPDGCESSRHLYAIQVESRDKLIMSLNSVDIYPGVHYRDNTEYSLFSSGAGQCPRARAASQRVLSLPMHLRLRHEDVKYISEMVTQYA